MRAEGRPEEETVESDIALGSGICEAMAVENHESKRGWGVGGRGEGKGFGVV